MKVEYRLRVVARCPVDDSHDVYDVIVMSDQMIQVEEILLEVANATTQALFQEDLTEQLADALDATVTSVGVHSGVETRCEVEP